MRKVEWHYATSNNISGICACGEPQRGKFVIVSGAGPGKVTCERCLKAMRSRLPETFKIKKQTVMEASASELKHERRCTACGHKLIVFSQEDDLPEYRVTIYVECVCRNRIPFIIPVN